MRITHHPQFIEDNIRGGAVGEGMWPCPGSSETHEGRPQQREVQPHAQESDGLVVGLLSLLCSHGSQFPERRASLVSHSAAAGEHQWGEGAMLNFSDSISVAKLPLLLKGLAERRQAPR